jgi:hypothetical protein
VCEVLFCGRVKEEAVNDKNVPDLETVFRKRFVQALLREVVDMPAAVFMILASPAVAHVNTVQIEQNKEGPEEKIIGDRDQ